MTRRWILPISACALVLAVGLSGPAQAESPHSTAIGYAAEHPSAVPGGFASWSELYEMQGRIGHAAEAVQAIVASSAVDSGYSGVYISSETRELVLYWKGTIPAAVQNVIDSERSTVAVRVVAARYSAAELDRETRRLTAGNTSAGVRLTEFGPLPDGSGIRVRYATTSSALAGRTGVVMSRAGLVAAVPALGKSTVDIIVESAGSSTQANLWDRFNDSPGYYAGARTTNCTTGFALNSLGESRLAYAAHCPTGTVRDGGGDVIGTTAGQDTGRDIMFIRASSLPKTWDGGINSTFSKPVQSGATSQPGDWLCTSGSFSGVICNIRVTLVNQSFFGAFPLVIAEQQAHTAAGGNGDSGGPVFTLPSPDNGKVIAKGIISRGDPATTVSCPGVPSGPNRSCGWRFGYADLVGSLPTLGSNLKTS